MTLNVEKATRLMSVTQFATEHPAFSQSALRHLIFDADRNGFRSVIRRVGKRKVLLDERSFFEWVEKQNHLGGRV
jgi:hypothetical protein